MKNIVNVLGTEYKIEIHKISQDDFLKKNNWAGYCCEEIKLIVIADMTEKEYFDMSKKEQDAYQKRTLRHEIIHAFLNESGLSENSSNPCGGWAKHEEMVDWIALQFPKILKVFMELDIL